MFHEVLNGKRLTPCLFDFLMGFLRERPRGDGHLLGEFPCGKNLPWNQRGFLIIDIGANPSEGDLWPVPCWFLETFRDVFPDRRLVLVRLLTKILDETD